MFFFSDFTHTTVPSFFLLPLSTDSAIINVVVADLLSTSFHGKFHFKCCFFDHIQLETTKTRAGLYDSCSRKQKHR